MSGPFRIFEDPKKNTFGPIKRAMGDTGTHTNKLCVIKGRGDSHAAVEELLAKLALQQASSARSTKAPPSDSDNMTSSSNSDPYADTPAPVSVATSDGRPDAAEVFRLKQELAHAQERMAMMDQELTQSRITKHTVEEAIGSPFPAAQRLAFHMNGNGLQPSQQSFDGSSYGRRVSGFSRMSSHAQSVAAPLNLDTKSANLIEYPGHSSNPSPASTRPASALGPHLGVQHGYTPPITPLGFQAPMTMPNGFGAFQQPPIGTRLSPTAAEFPGSGPYGWNGRGMMQQTGMAAGGAEQLNYRYLLDRAVSCNWKFIVDKIVGCNDQQASIFLQQKLKISTADQKYEIVQAIIDQAYPLMVNRFGNFLVQRCFDHGTPEQIVMIAQAIRGNTVNLSMDAFGCHVVQAGLDSSIPEEYKAMMVHELLRRIPETVIHRYSCHVWQKLFELRWSGSPPQIMKYVNEALRGMWHEVALGETGSLVCQCVFENCLEEDKRPCINEVLASIDVVAHGQFGNWCIQHICEHGAVADRARAVEHILRFAAEYSTDQFASKVVEKCLKIGGNNFLDRYLERVCEPRADCPRMALIDIAGDQFGNYLIQYILTQADQQRREMVAAQIRKHMVSLRGSKYGSRVAMLCSNPAQTIRPGPSMGMAMARPSHGYANVAPYTNMHAVGERYGGEMARPHQPLERAFLGMGRGGHGAAFR